MTEIFDYIPVITVVLMVLGLTGVMVYERIRIRENKETSN